MICLHDVRHINAALPVMPIRNFLAMHAVKGIGCPAACAVSSARTASRHRPRQTIGGHGVSSMGKTPHPDFSASFLSLSGSPQLSPFSLRFLQQFIISIDNLQQQLPCVTTSATPLYTLHHVCIPNCVLNMPMTASCETGKLCETS